MVSVKKLVGFFALAIETASSPALFKTSGVDERRRDIVYSAVLRSFMRRSKRPNYSNRMAFTGDILVMIIDGINSIKKQAINVPRLSNTI